MNNTRVAHTNRAGFTIVEMLIAIAAVSLLTVGIVQVFRTTARTVAAGRKVSNILTYANLLERQLRDDVSKMSRQGFLLVRSDITPTAVKNAPGDTTARQRRIDELMFFAEGRFVSQRDPVNPRITAEAPAARIYWGHGLKQDEAAVYTTPPKLWIDDGPTAAPSSSYFGNIGPNQYARDWVLARHVTLMTPPRPTPRLIVDPADRTRLINEQPQERDSIAQIGQLPATASIFRTLNRQTNLNSVQTLRGSDNQTYGTSTDRAPTFLSGLVDITASDLAEVRSFIMSPVDITNITTRSAQPFVRSNLEVPLGEKANGVNPTADQVLLNMRRKMRDALPADSERGQRIRVDATAPNPLGVGLPAGGTPQQDAWRRADQIMLAAHAAVPHCTEFIVEWSFGDVIPLASSAPIPNGEYDRIKWFGYPRLSNIGGAADDNNNTETYSDYVFSFGAPQPDAAARDRQTAQFFSPRVPQQYTYRSPVTNNNELHTLTARVYPRPYMFDGQLPGDNVSGYYGYFGFANPYWPPKEATNTTPTARATTPFVYVSDGRGPIDLVDLQATESADTGINQAPLVTLTGGGSTTPSLPLFAKDVNFNGVYEPQLGEQLNIPETLPWKWPRMLRITVTLVDPIDSSYERTFQFVFNLPEDPTTQRN